MIYALSQSTGISAYDILYKWSFENVLLISKAVPSYSIEDEEPGNNVGFKWDDRLDANNPDNFTINPNSSLEDEEFVI